MNTIKRNLGWLLVSQAATWIVSIVILLVAPRELGDKAFGQMTFAMVYVSFFELVALFGTSTFLMKVVARDTTSVGRYVVNALVLKVCMAVLLTCLAVALAVALDYPGQMVLLIGAYCIGMVFNALNMAVVGGLQGLQRMARPAMWDVTSKYVGGALGLTVLLNGGGLLDYALVFNLALAIPLVANFLNLWPELRGLHIEVELWRRILVGGFPFFILSGLLAFYGTIDIPLLQAFSGSETVGWYAVAYRWVSMPAFFAASVSLAFFPALSAEGVTVSDQFVKMANQAVRLVVLVATPAAVGIALIADDFLTRLYGSEFSQSVPLIRILALHIPIVGMDIVLGSTVVASDRQKAWVVVSVIAALFNPLLNLAAIPLTERLYDNGAIGAAVVTVMTELILMAGAIALRPRGVLDGPTTRLVLRMVVASLAMVPVFGLVGSSPLPVQILAGIVTYAVASLLLRTVSTRELREMLAGRSGRGRPEESAAPTNLLIEELPTS